MSNSLPLHLHCFISGKSNGCSASRWKRFVFLGRRVSVLLLFAFLPSLATAVPITTARGNGADSFIQSSLSNNAANTNYGAEPWIGIKHDTRLPGNNRKGYFRFDIGSIQDPIVGIDLDLAFIGTSPDLGGANPSTYNVFGLNDGQDGETWDEFSLTWNNAPGNDPRTAGGVDPTHTTFLGSFGFDPPRTAIGDLASFSSAGLLDFVHDDLDGLVTLIIAREQRNFRIESFGSKENGSVSPPTLNIVTDTGHRVPEAGGFSLPVLAFAFTIALNLTKRVS